MSSSLRWFVLLWLWRYVRLLVHCVASWTYQPIMPKAVPSFSSKDVTVVLCTLNATGLEFKECVKSILRNMPAKVIIVTPDRNEDRLKELFTDWPLIKVIGTKRANKRLQMYEGLKMVKTKFTAFVDDDVLWTQNFLHYLLAAMEDPSVGAAGPCQRLKRKSIRNIWHFLGAVYLERRNFEFSATMNLDGGTSALSGRTQLHRTSLIQTEEFYHEFLNEVWMGWVTLETADDDNFLTRWMFNHGHKIRIQYCKEVELQTSLANDMKFLNQCVRWFRTTWRSNSTSLFVEKLVWRKQPWCTYALYLSSFNPPALVMDIVLTYLLRNGALSAAPGHVKSVMVGFGIWLLFTKTVKLFPHFYRYPEDLWLLPVHVIFGYFHGFIKIYALLTINRINYEQRPVDERSPEFTPGISFTKETEYPFPRSGYLATKSALASPRFTPGSESMSSARRTVEDTMTLRLPERKHR